jgi:hypothetical protein
MHPQCVYAVHEVCTLHCQCTHSYALDAALQLLRDRIVNQCVCAVHVCTQ